MNCEICKSSNLSYYKLPLFDDEVDYYKCISCGFSSIVSFVSDDILRKIYGSDYWQKDYGWESRGKNIANLLRCFWDRQLSCMSICDYGSGKGYVSQLLRNYGCSVYEYDQYMPVENTTVSKDRYDLLIAIEVFEHFQDPVAEFAKVMEKKADMIFFTTSLCDNVDCMRHWWYARPEVGHFSFWSRKSLYKLSYDNGLYYQRLNNSNHMFLKSKTNVYFYKYLKYRTQQPSDLLKSFVRLMKTNLRVFNRKNSTTDY